MVVLIDGVNIICNNFPPSHQQEKTLVPFFFLPTLGRRRNGPLSGDENFLFWEPPLLPQK